MNVTLVRCFCILLLYNCICVSSKSQGTIQKNEGHFLATLDFVPSSGIYQQRKNRILNPSQHQGFQNEYRENSILVSGMVKGAVLTMDWWTLFGEPVENYNFQWTTTGRYSVYKEGGKGYTIERNELAKYPDLLLRFNAIKPLDIKFEIYWKHMGDAYKRMHFTFSSSNRLHSVKTVIDDGLLTEPSGKSPLSVPGIRQGKGENFISTKFDEYQHYSLTTEHKQSWLDEFNKANTIIVERFHITAIRWPVSEMLAIATLFEEYEKGAKKPSPMEEVQRGVAAIQSTAPYNNNDFWRDTYEEDKIKIYSETMLQNGFAVGNKITIGNISVENIESSDGAGWSWGTTVLHDEYDWSKVDYNNNLFDFIIQKNAKNLSGIQGIIAKKYKKILTQVNVPQVGNNISTKEFRVFDYHGNLVYKESCTKYPTVRANYILFPNSPYVLISWSEKGNNWNYSHNNTLLNLSTLEIITIPKFSTKGLDLYPLVYDKQSLLKDWDRDQKKFIESFRTEINTYKVLIVIPRIGEKPGYSTYYDYSVYAITNDDKFLNIKTIIF